VELRQIGAAFGVRVEKEAGFIRSTVRGSAHRALTASGLAFPRNRAGQKLLHPAGIERRKNAHGGHLPLRKSSGLGVIGPRVP
jgi:hypothetical protein